MLPFANYNISSPIMKDHNKRKRKKRQSETDNGGGGGDNLAVVKAAAWAWYQRNEGKPRELDLTRVGSRITPRPSRYKLEAAKNIILSKNRVLAENRVSKSSISYNDHDSKTLYSHLLDTYEIECISKRIDDLLPDDYHHDHEYGNDDHGLVERKIPYGQSNNGNCNGFVKNVNKRKLWGRLMLLGSATICGRNDDVDLLACRKTGKVAAVAVALARTARGK